MFQHHVWEIACAATGNKGLGVYFFQLQNQRLPEKTERDGRGYKCGKENTGIRSHAWSVLHTLEPWTISVCSVLNVIKIAKPTKVELWGAQAR